MVNTENNSFYMNFTPLGANNRRITYKGSLTVPSWFYPYEITLMRFLLYRKKMNMNSIVLICGNVRTGKSFDALVLGENFMKLTGGKFDVRKQCSFEIIPFLKWSQNSVDSVFILDEVGVSLNAQDWYEVQAKIMRNFIQAQGFRRNVLIIVLPSVAFLLKSIRFMINYIMETTEQGRCMWSKVKMDHTRGKAHIYTMGHIRFQLPSKEVVEEYKKMKKEWNDDQLKNDIEQLEAMKEHRYYTLPKRDLEKLLTFGKISQEQFIDDLTSKGYRKKDVEMLKEMILTKKSDIHSHFCYQCNNSWDSRTKKPQRCPNCNSRKWFKREIIDPV